MLNFGNLEILTAADQAVDRYHMLNAPKEFKKVMLTQKHALETEFMYGHPPTPPLRATIEAPAPPREEPPPGSASDSDDSAAAPLSPQWRPSQPAPARTDGCRAGSGRADADDESVAITETLARLADLRDRAPSSPRSTSRRRTSCSAGCR